MSQTVTLRPDDQAFIVRVMLTFDQAADDFLGDCERRGFRPRSVTTYRRTYTQFADHLPAQTDVSKITTDDVRRYLNGKNRLAAGTRAGFESHLSALFDWLLGEGKIAKNPMLPIARTRRIASEDLDVTTVSTEEVKLMLAAASGWTERLCLGVLVFTGVRRHAASTLKLSDYDELHKRLRFREKGGKTIWKPVPDELDNLIRSAISAGVYQDTDYLIPNRGPRPHVGRDGERDDRFIWHTIKTIAARVGVNAHTHAMRAAFAVFYLETHQRDTLALQSLMGHKSPATTQIYLRKLDRQAEMERVRDLSWGVAVGGDESLVEKPQIAENRFDEDRLVGAGGFEPPEADHGPDAAWLSGSRKRTANIDEETRPEGLKQAEPDQGVTREIVVLEGAEAEAFAARERLAKRGLDTETCLRLVGVTEGEGHFGIARLGGKSKGWRCLFVIKLRADDRPLLDEFQKVTGVGSVRMEVTPTRHNPCARWEVQKKDHLDQLADVFRAYPLRSKKRRDVGIWLEALDEWATIYGNEQTDWSRMEQLGRDLREVRKFNLTNADLDLLEGERLDQAVDETEKERV